MRRLTYYISSTRRGSAPVPGFTNSRSLLFDGVDEHLLGSNWPALNFERTDPFSLSFWIKVPPALNMSPIGKFHDGQYRGYFVQCVTTEGQVYFGVWNGPENKAYTGTVPGSLQTNVWQHVVCTYNGSSQKAGIKIYTQGQQRQTGTHNDGDNLSATIQTTRPFAVSNPHFFGLWTQGNLDEVSVWNKALTGSEVTAIYNNGAPTDLLTHSAAANLVAWWRCGDQDDTITEIKDRVGTLHLVPQNMEAGDIVEDTP